AEESGAAQTETDPEDADIASRLRDLIGAAILTALLLYISMGQMLPTPLPVPDFLNVALYPTNFALAQLILAFPVLYFGRRFFTGGLKALFHLAPNMDSLVAIGSGCSFLYSVVMSFMLPDNPHLAHSLYFESSATVLTLIMLGKYLEARSKRRTKDAIRRLMELKPETALLVRGRAIIETPIGKIKPGDTVLVKAGMRIPTDGEVDTGSGSVDESMLTGESIPVDKDVGSEVTGGSLNLTGTLYVRVTRVGADTTLSRIIKLVEDAQGRKAPVSKLADRVAGIFVPTVMSIALVAAVIWLIAGQDFAFALRVFTTVLVIACPCALGLATPTAIMVGTGLGAANGILIRSGEILEETHRITAVVLDKTGTVTEGRPEVTGVYPIGISSSELMSIAVSVERENAHPLARAITEYGEGCELIAVRSSENNAGRGVSAELEDGRRIFIGSAASVKNIPEAAVAILEKLAASGETPMLVTCDDELIGIIAASDRVRDTSTAAVAELHAMGVRVCLLTGDNRAAAQKAADIIGADEVIAEVLPADKAEKIRALREAGHRVMMVGDGINDAPALAEADVGAAIGGGSDVAVESGDIVLMRSDLRDIPRAVRLSKQTMRTIKQNLFWAFFYNTIGIPIAAGVLYPAFGLLLSPMIGGFAMSLSSVCVVTNALRLRGKKI
ncbi:MAG: cadmium-translocating P-type ATPase, partial [Oscillospiraceae bacterium]|nr:cadmium-translocating P-type ATPase [Oscillospiraceae bacterium]